MVGVQMGMGMAGVMDPQFGNQISLVGQFWNLIAILIFLSINGHHLYITTLQDSFTWVAPGTLNITQASFEGMTQATYNATGGATFAAGYRTDVTPTTITSPYTTDSGRNAMIGFAINSCQ